MFKLRPLHEVASEGETRQKQAKNRSHRPLFEDYIYK